MPHETIRDVYEYVEQRQRLLNRKQRAARKHGEVRQIGGRHLFVGRRDFFFGLLLLYYAPRCCCFEPVQTESGYVHRSEDVCYRVQLSLPLLDE
jgi:hypothetical protein